VESTIRSDSNVARKAVAPYVVLATVLKETEAREVVAANEYLSNVRLQGKLLACCRLSLTTCAQATKVACIPMARSVAATSVVTFVAAIFVRVALVDQRAVATIHLGYPCAAATVLRHACFITPPST
jgi:hypothetical protein